MARRRVQRREAGQGRARANKLHLFAGMGSGGGAIQDQAAGVWEVVAVTLAERGQRPPLPLPPRAIN
jgi:hypothetical protein